MFALERVQTIEEETWHAILLSLTDSIAIEFQQHDAKRG